MKQARTKLVLIFLGAVLLLASGVEGDPRADCYEDPTQPSCADFTMPDSITKDKLTWLCDIFMPNMPACTVNRLCLTGAASGPYCDPFKSYKMICGGGMSKMSNCSLYQQLCRNDSVVKQCHTEILPIPEGVELMADIKKLCSQMSMEGCDTCHTAGSCDTLSVYSSICLAMPTMDRVTCSSWSNYCSFIGTWPLCSYGNNQMPLMQMYFHVGIVDYVLFKEAVPRTGLEYFWALLIIFLVGVLYEGLKAGRLILEHRWKNAYLTKLSGSEKQSLLATVQDKPGAPQFAPFQIEVDTFRSLLRALEVFISYLLMLVAMTFNVGLFLAVIAGALFGTLLFGRFHHPINTQSASTEEASCH